MKKETMKKIPMFLASMLMLFIFTPLCSTSSVEAATAKEYHLTKATSKFYFDLNGDKKKESLTFQLKYDKYQYLSKLTVKVNKKNALVLDLNNNFIDMYVYYIPINSKTTLIGIRGLCDGGYREGLNRVYRYDNKKKTFVQVLDLKTNYKTSARVIKTTTKGFYVEYITQPSETGYITWNFFYNYRNNKAALKSRYATVRSKLGEYASPYKNPYYTKLFKQNKFKTDSPKTYTTTSTGTKAAFTTKRGDIVTLRKICFTKDYKIYLQFQKGSKRGWLTLGTGNSNWFCDIPNRLAG